MYMMLYNKICFGEPVDADEISESVKIQLMKLTWKRRVNVKKWKDEHGVSDEVHCHEAGQ